MKRLTSSTILSFAGRPATLALALFGLNAYVAAELFVTEYTQHMGSIEAAYIGLSRWIAAHPGELEWFPLWYGGIPFQNTYPPLLHILAALASAAARISPALAHHAASAFMYSLGPALLFLFADRVSGRRGASFLAALSYSLFAPSAALAPVVARDMGSAFASRRFHALVFYGEGPHITSMALIPLALLAFHHAMTRRTPVRTYVAALAIAAVALTNWLGAFALGAGLLCYLLAFHGGRLKALGWAALIGVIAYALASPWIPPSTIAAIRRNSQYTVGHYPLTAMHLLYGALLAAALILLWRLLAKRRAAAFVQFALLFAVVMGSIALTAYWFGIYLVPQPERYHLEMDMGITLGAVFALCSIAGRLPRPARWAGMGLVVILGAVQLDEHRYMARKWVEPLDIRTTMEYQVARWLQENMPERRVFAAGSAKFWMNAFADNPQLGGGFDQGITNPRIPMVTFGIPYTEGDPETCRTWMRAYGIDAAVVSGPNTRDAFRDYRDAGKFAGVFDEAWRDGADAIYIVPRLRRSLAHVVRPTDIVTAVPEYFPNVEPLKKYEAALEDASLPEARLEWRSPHAALITASVAPDQALSVQITHHPGWRASVAGEPRRVTADGLGQIIVEPECDGPCPVELVYDGGLEMRLAYLLCASALLAGGAWRVVAARRRDSTVQTGLQPG
ncbi:MAG: hypothetical protein KIT09_09390 [Bryobacteraceae bacterium]|nr:hypothetical protein [Bryobacteraceae bacterium]